MTAIELRARVAQACAQSAAGMVDDRVFVEWLVTLLVLAGRFDRSVLRSVAGVR